MDALNALTHAHKAKCHVTELRWPEMSHSDRSKADELVFLPPWQKPLSAPSLRWAELSGRSLAAAAFQHPTPTPRPKLVSDLHGTHSHVHEPIVCAHASNTNTQGLFRAPFLPAGMFLPQLLAGFCADESPFPSTTFHRCSSHAGGSRRLKRSLQVQL